MADTSLTPAQRVFANPVLMEHIYRGCPMRDHITLATTCQAGLDAAADRIYKHISWSTARSLQVDYMTSLTNHCFKPRTSIYCNAVRTIGCSSYATYRSRWVDEDTCPIYESSNGGPSSHAQVQELLNLFPNVTTIRGGDPTTSSYMSQRWDIRPGRFARGKVVRSAFLKASWASNGNASELDHELNAGNDWPGWDMTYQLIYVFSTGTNNYHFRHDAQRCHLLPIWTSKMLQYFDSGKSDPRIDQLELGVLRPTLAQCGRLIANRLRETDKQPITEINALCLQSFSLTDLEQFGIATQGIMTRCELECWDPLGGTLIYGDPPEPLISVLELPALVDILRDRFPRLLTLSLTLSSSHNDEYHADERIPISQRNYDGHIRFIRITLDDWSLWEEMWKVPMYGLARNLACLGDARTEYHIMAYSGQDGCETRLWNTEEKLKPVIRWFQRLPKPRQATMRTWDLRELDIPSHGANPQELFELTFDPITHQPIPRLTRQAREGIASLVKAWRSDSTSLPHGHVQLQSWRDTLLERGQPLDPDWAEPIEQVIEARRLWLERLENLSRRVQQHKADVEAYDVKRAALDAWFDELMPRLLAAKFPFPEALLREAHAFWMDSNHLEEARIKLNGRLDTLVAESDVETARRPYSARHGEETW